jgi:hypothetical protein
MNPVKGSYPVTGDTQLNGHAMLSCTGRVQWYKRGDLGKTPRWLNNPALYR